MSEQDVINLKCLPEEISALRNERMTGMDSSTSAIFEKHLGPNMITLENELIEVPKLKDIIGSIEGEVVRQVYSRYKNTYKAAEALGISQSSLVRKLHKHSVKSSQLN